MSWRKLKFRESSNHRRTGKGRKQKGRPRGKTNVIKRQTKWVGGKKKGRRALDVAEKNKIRHKIEELVVDK